VLAYDRGTAWLDLAGAAIVATGIVLEAVRRIALPLAAWSVVSPLLMSVLLLKVSGVALLEKDIGERRPAYRDYVRRTSAFFPWPPRRGG